MARTNGTSATWPSCSPSPSGRSIWASANGLEVRLRPCRAHAQARAGTEIVVVVVVVQRDVKLAAAVLKGPGVAPIAILDVGHATAANEPLVIEPQAGGARLDAF